MAVRDDAGVGGSVPASQPKPVFSFFDTLKALLLGIVEPVLEAIGRTIEQAVQTVETGQAPVSAAAESTPQMQGIKAQQERRPSPPPDINEVLAEGEEQLEVGIELPYAIYQALLNEPELLATVLRGAVSPTAAMAALFASADDTDNEAAPGILGKLVEYWEGISSSSDAGKPSRIGRPPQQENDDGSLPEGFEGRLDAVFKDIFPDGNVFSGWNFPEGKGIQLDAAQVVTEQLRANSYLSTDYLENLLNLAEQGDRGALWALTGAAIEGVKGPNISTTLGFQDVVAEFRNAPSVGPCTAFVSMVWMMAGIEPNSDEKGFAEGWGPQYSEALPGQLLMPGDDIRFSHPAISVVSLVDKFLKREDWTEQEGIRGIIEAPDVDTLGLGDVVVSDPEAKVGLGHVAGIVGFGPQNFDPTNFTGKVPVYATEEAALEAVEQTGSQWKGPIVPYTVDQGFSDFDFPVPYTRAETQSAHVYFDIDYSDIGD